MPVTPEPNPFDLALDSFQLGESETFLRLDGEHDFNRATARLLGQARREVYILTPDFEPERFNNVEFADALSAFARSSRYADTRILLGDPSVAVRWGHKVVALARRMPTRLRIRQIDEDDFDPAEAFIVADDIGLLRRDSQDGYIGSLAAKSIPHAQRASLRFAELWERSRAIADFRILDI
ncbi:MAG: hypothetical protein K0S46_435 [Moraxellaceae bacterium]|jgi:hypothetical protein|nr:hypothetical protein [Moraxellaceae bacterium]